MIDFTKYLVHTADVYHVVDTLAGDAFSGGDATVLSTVASPTTCFAYFGDQLESLSSVAGASMLIAAPTGWQVLLPLEFINDLRVGAKVSGILDENGDAIREAGYVKSFNVYRHPYYGAQIVLAKLAE